MKPRKVNRCQLGKSRYISHGPPPPPPPPVNAKTCDCNAKTCDTSWTWDFDQMKAQVSTRRHVIGYGYRDEYGSRYGRVTRREDDETVFQYYPPGMPSLQKGFLETLITWIEEIDRTRQNTAQKIAENHAYFADACDASNAAGGLWEDGDHPEGEDGCYTFPDGSKLYARTGCGRDIVRVVSEAEEVAEAENSDQISPEALNAREERAKEYYLSIALAKCSTDKQRALINQLMEPDDVASKAEEVAE